MFEREHVITPENKSTEIESRVKMAAKILAMQQACGDFVVPLNEEAIEDLIQRGLMYTKERDGEILTTIYRKPLDEELSDVDQRQIYKLGGLTVLNRDISTLKALKEMIDEVKSEAIMNGNTIMMCSGNPVVQKLLKEFGMFEFSPEEFATKFPAVHKLFMDSETKKDFEPADKIYIKFKEEFDQENNA